MTKKGEKAWMPWAHVDAPQRKEMKRKFAIVQWTGCLIVVIVYLVAHLWLGLSSDIYLLVSAIIIVLIYFYIASRWIKSKQDEPKPIVL